MSERDRPMTEKEQIMLNRINQLLEKNLVSCLISMLANSM